MKRTYRGPIIETPVELGVVSGDERLYKSVTNALAVDVGTGEIILLCRFAGGWLVSMFCPTDDGSYHTWTVTL